MTQVVQTSEQQTYLACLVGYDYSIQYHFGMTNVVADALSRIPDNSIGQSLLLSVLNSAFLKELKQELARHKDFIAFRQAILSNPSNYTDCTVTQDLVMQEGRIWLLQRFKLFPEILAQFHATPIGGHMGINKTFAWVSENFVWPNMKKDVHQYVIACLDCQHTKYETRKTVGLLCPLPILSLPWKDLSLDFIMGLPTY